MSQPVDLAEFVSAYVVETEEHLVVANAQLLAIDASLRKGESDPRSVRELFRALHTIKGVSAMVGVEPVVAVSHRMEAVLRTVDRGSGRLELHAVDVLLQGVRVIEQCVHAVAIGRSVPSAPPSLLDALDSLDLPAAIAVAAPALDFDLEPVLATRLGPFEREQLTRGVADGRRAVCVNFIPAPARASLGLSITSVRERVGQVAEIVKVLPVSLPIDDSHPGGLAFAMLVLTNNDDSALETATGMPPGSVRTLTATAGPRATLSDSSASVPDERLEADAPDTDSRQRSMVRVEVDRLDDAMERLSALIVTRARFIREIAVLTERGVDTRSLVQVTHDYGRQLRDLRAAILRLRMVPVADVLERVPLIVRAMRRTSGKSVRLELDAGRTELDKGVAERIFPAIVQLVRNAIDHAVEPPDVRRRLGKPDEALLRISCFTRSNTQMELTVSDDGQGVDRAAVARQAGVLDLEPITDAALLHLLCRPGLSTRAQASTTSGRGIGMDIVRRITVDQLGGELLMATSPGVGTVFTLRVPLTISIVDAFAFECGKHRFVVPLSMIDEIVDVDTARVVRGPIRADPTPFPLACSRRRGSAVPLVALETALGLDASDLPSRKALVVRRAGQPIAFAVDRMLGQQEIVVRPLTDPMLQVPGVSGATDLGDGRPTLVLDLCALGARIGGPAALESRA